MSMVPENRSVGFVGTGVMGASMAGHLIDAGYELHVYTRTKAKAADLLNRGAKWHDGVAGTAAAGAVIITIVGFPADVEEVYFGSDGIIENAPKGAVLIDMTTSKPSLAVRISKEATKRGLAALDAPVSGGDTGAREARLSIMAGGPKEAFDRALPLLRVMGENIVYQGPAGCGQHTKMANQIAIAAGMLGVCEALVYAKKAGLDQNTVLKSIGKGAAGSWSLSNLAPRMIKGDFEPGFYVKHFIKDMRIALESAAELGFDTPGLDLAKRRYEQLAAEGGEDWGTQGLYTLYDR
ncbi:MAG: NAD-binding protein [Chitinivibrionales bacterium]|nr:NAD-binding protein [Chitinivibrionales bacterium]MBD3359025.1 NAD-binding protein [Chitinivibrionales bacterium]